MPVLFPFTEYDWTRPRHPSLHDGVRHSRFNVSFHRFTLPRQSVFQNALNPLVASGLTPTLRHQHPLVQPFPVTPRYRTKAAATATGSDILNFAGFRHQSGI